MNATAPEGFLRRPHPYALGWRERGAEIATGRIRLRGAVIDGSLFSRDPDLPDAAMAELHGFGWLDDLAALGTSSARDAAQSAVLVWLRRNPHPADDAGTPVWWPQVTGRRVLRWVFHAGTLLPGLDRAAAAPVFASLHAQLSHLEHHAHKARGTARIEACAGLAIAAMSLRGSGWRAGPALAALESAAHDTLAAGTLPSRNPEALLDCAALLVWTARIAAESGMRIPQGIDRAITRSAAMLRALRHADGSLPRMHGGDIGAPNRLDEVLLAAGSTDAPGGLAMGYARLAQADSTLLLDAAPPPAGTNAHAGTLGFEFTTGNQPLITTCGSGAGFNHGWAEAGRATAAHSTLVLDGLSSARIAADGGLDPAPEYCRAHLCHAPDLPGADAALPGHDCMADDARIIASHDGWRASHGLYHRRELRLRPDGLALEGVDSLVAPDGQARARSGPLESRQPPDTVGAARSGVALHFHLHPDIRAATDTEGAILQTPAGAIWRFRHDGPGSLTVEPSARLDPAQPAPVPARQIMVRMSRADMLATPIRWRLERG